MARSKSEKQTNGGVNLGFEATLWAAADKLRGHMDAAEYKHVVLGLIRGDSPGVRTRSRARAE
jgi:type I restriction enzyme M protein